MLVIVWSKWNSHAAMTGTVEWYDHYGKHFVVFYKISIHLSFDVVIFHFQNIQEKNICFTCIVICINLFYESYFKQQAG